MSNFIVYLNDTAAIFLADGVVVPASAAEMLSGMSVEVLVASGARGDTLEAAQVCELVRDGVVVARARLP